MKKKNVDFNQEATALFPSIILVDDQKNTDVNYVVSLNWQANDNVKLYASQARGTKSGGWNVDFVGDGNIEFKGESVDNYEVGMKSELLGGRVRFNAAAFISKFKDMQIFRFQTTNAGTNLVLDNAGKATAKGFEIDFAALLTTELQINGGIGYADTTFDEFKDGGGPGIDYDGNRLPRAPKWTMSIAAEYTHALTSDLDGIINVDFAYRSAQFYNPDNLPSARQEGYGLINGKIAIASNANGWEISVWGKNLADKLYTSNRGVSFLGIPFDLYAPPRTYGVAAKMNF